MAKKVAKTTKKKKNIKLPAGKLYINTTFNNQPSKIDSIFIYRYPPANL